MRVLFVSSVERGPSLRHPLPSLGAMQFGISYISAALQRAGASTRLVVLSSESEPDSLVMTRETIEQWNPQLVAFTCVYSQFPFMTRVAERIKMLRPDIFQVVGGPHVSLNPVDTLGKAFDATCVGEGEYPMVELLEQLRDRHPPRGIPNLWLKQADGCVEKNPTRPFLEDSDLLPFPDRAMWLPWVNPADATEPSLLLGRGCPYLCAYCCNHALRKLAEGKYVRLRSPGNIVEEIRSLYDPMLRENPCLYLEVEAFGVSKPWAIELCRALQKLNAELPQAIRYHTNFRITAKTLDPEIFAAMRQANIRRINIGLEAGSERVRRDILKRNYTNAEFARAVQLAREHDLEFNLFNMVGLPGETPEEHLETVRLNRETRPHASYTSIFFPYPGTVLHQVCEKRGLLKQDLDVNRERQQAVLDTREFPRRSVQRAYDLFDYRIHQGHWPLHVRLRKLAGHHLRKSNTAHRLFSALLPLWHRLVAKGLVKSYGRPSLDQSQLQQK